MGTPTSEESTGPERKTLTDLLRQRAAFFIEPVITPLARMGLSPNVLTIGGMLAHFVVAWLITQGEMRWAAVAILLIAPLDALDGALARKLGRKPGFGAFLDSTLDRLAEIVLFGGFILYYAEQGDTVLIAVSYLAITGSLMVSYARARAEALDLSCKIGILSRVERYVVLTLFLLLDLPVIALAIIAVFAYITVGQRILHVWRQTQSE